MDCARSVRPRVVATIHTTGAYVREDRWGDQPLPVARQRTLTHGATRTPTTALLRYFQHIDLISVQAVDCGGTRVPRGHGVCLQHAPPHARRTVEFAQSCISVPRSPAQRAQVSQRLNAEDVVTGRLREFECPHKPERKLAFLG